MLVEAGIDFVAYDATNAQSFDWIGDTTQLRPFEVLCEEWTKLRQQGIETPRVAIWQNLKDVQAKGKSTASLYKHYLNYSYAEGSPFEELILRDEKSGKKVFFTVDHPSSDLIKEVEATGKIVVQEMWEPLKGSPTATFFKNGSFAFFSPCRDGDGVFTPSISSEPNWQCNQSLTTNAKIGRHGTSITVSGGYQVLCADMPLVHSGKLGGLTLQKQFHTAMLQNAKGTLDYLMVGTFNEHIAGAWANSFEPTMPWCGPEHACNRTLFRPVGMETDKQLKGLEHPWYDMFVDIYGDSYTRDIEPTKQDGGAIWELFRSCMRVFQTGESSCVNVSEACCQYPPERQWRNVWSMQTVARGQNGSVLGHNSDLATLLTTNYSQVRELVAAGTHKEICAPLGGSTAFCHPGAAIEVAKALNISNSYSGSVPGATIAYLNRSMYFRGPFLLWAAEVSNASNPIYRCIASSAATRSGESYFPSSTSDCLGLGTVDVTLGFAAVTRTSNMPRSLRLCSGLDGQLGHSLDGACETSGEGHTLEHLGFVH
eukprot:SAG31_NODE_5078_length_2756_cov_1.607452_2_plen_540_part_00